jgi:flavin-dependent dehydrogenase
MGTEYDVLIAGAGPAGAIAAWRLATAGARVCLIDRARFPRPKLCGDTLNPGAVALLAALPLADQPLDAAPPLAGMLVTGPRARVVGRYGGGVVGRAIERRVFDHWLLSRAVAAGATLEENVVAKAALLDTTAHETVVRGATLTSPSSGGSRRERRITARITIAADGRSSPIARSVGLARFPAAPRRWAFGTYATGVAGTTDLGEMHVRGRGYLGIAPLGAGVSNVCVVTGPRPGGRTPMNIVRDRISKDPTLAERFADARFDAPVTVLGPLAVEADACGMAGLLLAGDAAGFVDPMTGDGLHLAMRGALLAADQALLALADGNTRAAVDRLTVMRREALGPKLRFNRMLRRLVELPAAVEAAALAARVAPAGFRWVIRYAGDAA